MRNDSDLSPDIGERDEVPSGTGGRLAVAISLLFVASLLVVYGAQTGVGRWQVDEFLYFTAHRDHGWHAYFERFYVSPRPFSELLIYVYGSIVLAFQQALVPEALLVVWGGSLVGMGAAAYATLRRTPGRLWAAMVLAIAPMVFVLQVAPVTEMFYWPVGTVAYLPMVAAITSVVFLLGNASDRPARRGWCCLALLLAVSSHEMGAAFAIGFGLVAGAVALMTGRVERRAVLWWLVPALVGLGVMLGLVVFRSGVVDLGSDTKPYTGRLLASGLVAARQMAIDVMTTSSLPHDGPGIAAALLQKTGFAVGFGLIWIQWGAVRSRRWHLSLGVGLGVAIYFSLLAGYYHYGSLCCERHETARQWLIELLFILAAVSVLLQWGRPAARSDGWAGPLLLIVSLLPVIVQIPAIRSDLGVVALSEQARVKTWTSGLAAGTDMQFYMPPDNTTMLIHGTSEAVGTYDLADHPRGPNDLVEAVGTFFGKRTVSACQAWQTRDSFLIDGTFIPACPPHAGPPDIVFNTP